MEASADNWRTTSGFRRSRQARAFEFAQESLGGRLSQGGKLSIRGNKRRTRAWGPLCCASTEPFFRSIVRSREMPSQLRCALAGTD